MGLVLPTPKDVFFAGTLGGFQPDSCAGGGTTGAKCSGHEQFGTERKRKNAGGSSSRARRRTPVLLVMREGIRRSSRLKKKCASAGICGGIAPDAVGGGRGFDILDGDCK